MRAFDRFAHWYVYESPSWLFWTLHVVIPVLAIPFLIVLGGR